MIRQRTTQRAAVEHSQQQWKTNKKGRNKRSMMREITTEWLRLSVKADALVTEPMRMQETGCGWCLLSGQQSPSPYLLAKTLVATAHSSPMAEITVTCREHTRNMFESIIWNFTHAAAASHFPAWDNVLLQCRTLNPPALGKTVSFAGGYNILTAANNVENHLYLWV